jgi:O-antigen/teichoic acid export membrane protein
VANARMKSGSLLRNTLLYVPAQLFAPLLQFVVTVVWTHLFDPAAFGLITFVVAAQELTGGLGLNWWSMYLMRFRKRYPGADVERFRAMDGRVVAFGAAGQAILALPVLSMVGVAPTPGLLAATIAYLVTRTMLTHYSEWARSDHRIGVFTLAQLAGPVAGSGLSIVGALALGPDPGLALAAMAIGQAIGVVIVMLGMGLRLRVGKFDAAIFAEARQYGLPLIFSGLFLWAASNGVRILVEAGEGIAGVGLFSVGWGLALQL